MSQQTTPQDLMRIMLDLIQEGCEISFTSSKEFPFIASATMDSKSLAGAVRRKNESLDEFFSRFIQRTKKAREAIKHNKNIKDRFDDLSNRSDYIQNRKTHDEALSKLDNLIKYASDEYESTIKDKVKGFKDNFEQTVDCITSSLNNIEDYDDYIFESFTSSAQQPPSKQIYALFEAGVIGIISALDLIKNENFDESIKSLFRSKIHFTQSFRLAKSQKSDAAFIREKKSPGGIARAETFIPLKKCVVSLLDTSGKDCPWPTKEQAIDAILDDVIDFIEKNNVKIKHDNLANLLMRWSRVSGEIKDAFARNTTRKVRASKGPK